MNLTEAQRNAIAARGNVLVVAGAGTGKTRTLVERCLQILTQEKPPVTLDQVLIVTFTEAAAAEVRQRIRARLEQEAARSAGGSRWLEQLALFESAWIGTLHSFCFELVRRHFFQLELDPQLAVLSKEEAHLLAQDTLRDLLEKHYLSPSQDSEPVRRLIRTYGGTSDAGVARLVLRLHHYTQTLPDPDGWFDQQFALFDNPVPERWRQWWQGAVTGSRESWLRRLSEMTGNDLAAQCVALLQESPGGAAGCDWGALLNQLSAVSANCPRGCKKKWLEPLKWFFDEIEFLKALAGGGESDPLAEDWEWSRPHMTALLKLAREFAADFSATKREMGALDFHDLEQYALRLLWEASPGQPTPIARQWQRQLRFVFVDEYQDINAAQDKIIQLLSGEGPAANRFLVGDVKQSIYRFRLADPRIFRTYADTWRGAAGTVIPLRENFRSREGVIEFVNSFFAPLMRPDCGGVAYDETARLRFGAPQERAALSRAANPEPPVELLLRLTGEEEGNGGEGAEEEGNNGWQDLLEAEKEARLVALRLLQLRNEGHPVWDEAEKKSRPARWSDMAVLLRAPSGRADSYAKEFARLGVPLEVARGDFYQTLEVTDLVSLLQVLDNPLQDLPLLAVLRSPLVGLSVDELALIRLAVVKAHYWTALVRWHEAQRAHAAPVASSPVSASPPPLEGAPAATLEKVGLFLDRVARWRDLARQVSLSQCLESILAETHYAEWLRAQERGEQRYANVRRLANLARQFDQCHRQGLFRFLQYVEAQQEAGAEPEVPVTLTRDAVRLMSIHQSKGLEFPIVVVADMTRKFNESDLRAEIILDEEYGLCPQVKPPHAGQRYPSLPYWLARRRQRAELLGEELRLLYVAMTRARDTLLLSASVPAKRFREQWAQPDSAPEPERARSFADWLAFWFARNATPVPEGATSGQGGGARWTIYDSSPIPGGERMSVGPKAGSEEPAPVLAAPLLQQLLERLGWRYPHLPATRQPAKATVSEIRRQAQEDDESVRPFGSRDLPRPVRERRRLAGEAGADIGTAHHLFLERVNLERVSSLEALKDEAARLVQEGWLAPEQAAGIEFDAIARFWQSELGSRLLARRAHLRRELPFTARFSTADLTRLAGLQFEPGLEHEFMVVQGVADMVLVQDEAIWLVDFKTDNIEAKEVRARTELYAPQIRIYAEALAGIYRRPVTEAWLYFLRPGKGVKVSLS